jgi:hypothetical protein
MSNKTATKIHTSRMHHTLDLGDKNPINSVTSVGLQASSSQIYKAKMARGVPKQLVYANTVTPEVLRAIEQTSTAAGRFALFKDKGSGSNSLRFA